MTRASLARALGLGGIFGPLLFAAVVVCLAALRPEYSHVSNFISELGADDTPHAALMNYLGFLPTGLLIAGVGIALARVLPAGRVEKLGAALVVLFGLGAFASGLYNCDAGCPQGSGSLENAIHNNIAPVTFLSVIVAAGLLGLRFRRLDAWRHLAFYSIVTSLVALAFMIVLVASLETRALTGLWQRLLLATVFTWCGVVGLRAHRIERAAAPDAVASVAVA